MTTNSEATYGLPPEKNPLAQDEEAKSRRKSELVKHYTDLANALLKGTISVDQFATEQAERVLSDEAEAEHDPLTGLLNRRGFFNSFDERLLSFRRVLRELPEGQRATPGCLVIVDLDNFGAVNKQYGDAFGDSTLQQVAVTLTEGVRPQDPVSRFGGEEFLLFLVGAKLEDVIGVMRRISTSLPKDTEANLDGIRQTATFGVVQFQDNLTEEEITVPQNRETIFGQAYKDASEAMRFAKAAGKNLIGIKRPDRLPEIVTPPMA